MSTEVLTASNSILLWLVPGPDLKLTPVVVLKVPMTVCEEEDDESDAPDADRKSDLIKPDVPLWRTLDHPLACCSITSTLVPAANVLITLSFVEGPVLKFTALVVFRDETV